jgi:serine/threonine protein kinase
MGDPFDPYYQWLGIPPKDQPPNHYRLLGIERFEANPDVIQHAADQRMAHLRALQTGRHSALSQQLLNEVAAARVCLLRPQKKADYDARLRAKLGSAEAARAVEHDDARKPDGMVFGEYLLLDQLGSGATGPVFKAKHRTMGRVVALKVLSPEALRSRERVERFRRKVKILAQLQHPNLVAAYDAGERDGTHYLVMQYVDGWDLAALVKEHGPLPVGHAVNYVVQAAAGLGYAHRQGIYHRNVKPSNLLVDRQGEVKVIGLGLARVDFDVLPAKASMGPELTAPGQVMGTVDYMAPEQAVDSSQVDHRTDVYALGCTLSTLLTGRPPYPAKSPMKKVLAHRDHPIPSLCAVRSDVPAGLDAVFQKMLAKRPDQRPQSMEEVITALEGVLDEEAL